MNKRMKRIAILLIVALLAPTLVSFIPLVSSLTLDEVYAATAKAKLGTSNLTVGVASSPEYIYIENASSQATYVYKSSNEKIATIGEWGYINGIAKGKATVTVTEVVDGKKTELGKIKVSVVGASLDKETLKVGVKNEQYLFIKYANRNAVYKFTSADTKIAKVDKYGIITGVKLGKTSISVTQTLNGKSTKLGSVPINVVNADFYEKEVEAPVNQPGSAYVTLKFMNPDAVYKYTSANSKIAKVDKYGAITGVKVGSTTISVTETYNKKTVKIGSAKVKVVEPYLDPKQEAPVIGINSASYLTDVVRIVFQNWENAVYTCESKDSDIVWAGYVDTTWGDKAFKIKGVGIGKTTLTVYETIKKVKRKLGTVSIMVKEIPLSYFGFDSYSFEDENGTPTITYQVGDEYAESLAYYFYSEPYNTTEPRTYTSSDEKIITIDENGNVKPVGVGTAVITVSCGEYSYELQAVVKAVELTDLYFDTYDFEQEDGVPTTSLAIGEESWFSLNDYLSREPYNATDAIVFASKDEKIATVNSKGYITGVAKGETTITISCGDFSYELKVVVEDSDY